MTDPYSGREQTETKHFILRSYLQALAFKVLTFSDITYVDGFSGPWETKRDDLSDSSFMIAISVLQDAQKKILQRTGNSRKIRCFFSENNPKAFAQMQQAVAKYHQPTSSFEIKTYCGNFEDAVSEIHTFIATSFPLIFIDPTGWTGYSFNKIKLLFKRPKCEVLINFMYEFVNRFSHSDDEDTIASLDPILGGVGWRDRLDPKLPRGRAVEKLFRETLKTAGNFEFVVSTRIDKPTADRPHFFITYGTKNPDGLKTFRKIEYDALRKHEKIRATVKEKQREKRSSMVDLFTGYQADVQEASIDEIVEEQKPRASADLMMALPLSGPLKFSRVVVDLLEPYMLRETDVKNICVQLAKAGRIENTWGAGNRKPHDNDMVKLKANLPSS